MTKKHKKVCATLNYIEHFLILPSTITVCVSISPFASLSGIPIGITSPAVGLLISAITAAIKKDKPLIKKKKKKHDNATATKIYQFKAKNSEIKDYTLCLGNISKDFSINNMKQNRIKGVVIFFQLISILLILTIF